MNDPAAGISVLHVIVRAGATNSQYNEHCLPVAAERRITVCSLFPADVVAPPTITMVEGDGSTRGCFRALGQALDRGPYDVVHVHAPASGVLTLATYLRRRRSRRDLVFTVHNSWQNFRRRNRLFLRVILALFPTVVVCGAAAHDSMPRRLRRRRAARLHVVPNGVDVQRIDAARAATRAGDRSDDRSDDGPDDGPGGSRPGRTVVSLNRLIPIKDPGTLLRAFADARGPDDRLLLVGDGALRADLERSVRDLGLAPYVTFTGIVARAEVYRILDRADVVVSTSAGEGLPVALMEAMGCGCPAVASDIPPHREIARVASELPLVPVGDAQAFAHELGRLLAAGPEHRRAVGAQLRAHVLEHFSVQTMNDSYGEVYMSVIQRNGGGRGQRMQSGDDDPPSVSDLVRERLGIVVLLSVLGGVGGYVGAELQAPVYKGETTLAVGSGVGAATDEDTQKANAALATTYADLARREPVLGPVAAAGFADDWRQLQDDVHAQTGDKNNQLVQISAYAGDAATAEALATAVGEELLTVTEEAAATPQREFVQDQLSGLRADITSTEDTLRAVEAQMQEAAGTEEATEAQERVGALRSRLLRLQGTYSDLQASDQAGIGTVTLVDEAWVTRSPLRPTPVVLAAAGAGAGFLLALGFAQLASRRRRRKERAAAWPVRTSVVAPRDRPAPTLIDDLPVREDEAWAAPEELWDDALTSRKGNDS
jgi:glycosyltransferase involved in cell wall biosynthesis